MIEKQDGKCRQHLFCFTRIAYSITSVSYTHLNTQAYCTEMEGAAIGQAAYLNKIPYLVIRAISDKADDSAHVDYPTFERQAIRHTVNLVSSMMERL